MKMLVLFLTMLFTLSVSSLGQSLSEGSVTAMEPVPQGDGTTAYDFQLCCGVPEPPGGFLGNGFAINNGAFSLFFKPRGQTQGYTVNGTVNTWDTQQVLDSDCSIQSGTLKDVSIKFGIKTLTGLVAEYSQFYCHRGSTYWLGSGGLSVHSQ